MSNVGIYTITSPSNKVYVGQSINIESRKNNYTILRCKRQPRIYNSLKKYGFDAHKFEVVLYLNDDTNQKIIDYWEQFFMDHYRNEGFELMNIREGGSKGKLSEETKQKLSEISKKQKRRPCSEETRRKIGAKHKGKIVSEESRKKSSESHKGFKPSLETILKLKQRIHSLETRTKMSNSHKGHYVSIETREKLRKAHTGKKLSPESREKIKNIVNNRSLETRHKMSESRKRYLEKTKK